MSSKQASAPVSDHNTGQVGVKVLRVSQIVVNLVLLNEHDAPVTPEPIAFAGTESGTAAENLAIWLQALPMQLELAAAQADAPETNGTP